MNFFGVFLTLDYDYMCSETDFTQEKKSFFALSPKSETPICSYINVRPLIVLRVFFLCRLFDPQSLILKKQQKILILKKNRNITKLQTKLSTDFNIVKIT